MFPQVPQFCGSVCRFTHAEPQQACVLVQQAPLQQVCRVLVQFGPGWPFVTGV